MTQEYSVIPLTCENVQRKRLVNGRVNKLECSLFEEFLSNKNIILFNEVLENMIWRFQIDFTNQFIF